MKSDNGADGALLPAALMRALIHDVRNPLTAVMGYSQLIKGAAHDEKIGLLSSRLLAACREMKDLLSRISLLLKLDRGELEIVRSEFDVGKSVRSIADALAETHDKVLFRVEAGPGGFRWTSDEELFDMIVEAMLHHLISTSRTGDAIETRISRRGGALVVEFSGGEGYIPAMLNGHTDEDWKVLAVRRERQNPDPGFLFSFIRRASAALGIRLESGGVPESEAGERGMGGRLFRLILP